jgi:hypothetical protein
MTVMTSGGARITIVITSGPSAGIMNGVTGRGGSGSGTNGQSITTATRETIPGGIADATIRMITTQP